MSEDTKIGHNGAPAYESRSDLPPNTPPMEWFKCGAKDMLDELLRLPLDERGFCATAWLSMYADMEMLPADDRMAAHRLAIDVRSYRSYLGKSTERRSTTSNLPLLYRRPSGRVSNHRYEDEITAYVDSVKKRREAAAEREAKRKEARQNSPKPASNGASNAHTSAGDVRGMSDGSGDIPRTSSGQSPDIPPSNVHTSSGKSQQIQRGDGHGAARPVPEVRHGSGTEREREGEREKKGREESPPTHQDAAREGEVAMGGGVFVNAETVRHRTFTLSIEAIAMQLALANLGMSTNEARDVARKAAIAHAMQWAAEINAGKLSQSVVPSNPANFIRGSIVSQRNRSKQGLSKAPAHMQRY